MTAEQASTIERFLAVFSRFLSSHGHDTRILLDPLGLVRAEPCDQLHDLAIFFCDVTMQNWFMMEDAVAKFSDRVAPNI